MVFTNVSLAAESITDMNGNCTKPSDKGLDAMAVNPKLSAEQSKAEYLELNESLEPEADYTSLGGNEGM